LTRSRNTKKDSLKWRVMPAILIAALWTGNTAAFAGPRYVQSLFDLTIEELMEVRIGAQLRLDYWTRSDEASCDAGGRDVRDSSSHACRKNAVKTDRPEVTRNQ
jgi:hypothetical protein